MRELLKNSGLKQLANRTKVLQSITVFDQRFIGKTFALEKPVAIAQLRPSPFIRECLLLIHTYVDTHSSF